MNSAEEAIAAASWPVLSSAPSSPSHPHSFSYPLSPGAQLPLGHAAADAAVDGELQASVGDLPVSLQLSLEDYGMQDAELQPSVPVSNSPAPVIATAPQEFSSEQPTWQPLLHSPLPPSDYAAHDGYRHHYQDADSQHNDPPLTTATADLNQGASSAFRYGHSATLDGQLLPGSVSQQHEDDGSHHDDAEGDVLHVVPSRVDLWFPDAHESGKYSLKWLDDRKWMRHDAKQWLHQYEWASDAFAHISVFCPVCNVSPGFECFTPGRKKANILDLRIKAIVSHWKNKHLPSESDSVRKDALMSNKTDDDHTLSEGDATASASSSVASSAAPASASHSSSYFTRYLNGTRFSGRTLNSSSAAAMYAASSSSSSAAASSAAAAAAAAGSSPIPADPLFSQYEAFMKQMAAAAVALGGSGFAPFSQFNFRPGIQPMPHPQTVSSSPSPSSSSSSSSTVTAAAAALAPAASLSKGVSMGMTAMNQFQTSASSATASGFPTSVSTMTAEAAEAAARSSETSMDVDTGMTDHAAAASSSTPVVTTTGTRSGVAALIAILRNSHTSADDVQTACLKLLDLSVHADNEMSIVHSDGVEAMLEVLKQHPAHPPVMHAVCGMFINLAFNESNRELIAAAGGVEAILAVLQHHVGHMEVVEVAFRAMRIITQPNEAKTNWHMQRPLYADGVKVVLNILKSHLDHSVVVAEACGVIYHLGYNFDNHLSLSRFGGTEFLLSAVQRHIEHTAVVVMACQTLGWLTRYDDNQTVFAGRGGAETMHQVLKTHPKHLTIIAYATLMLTFSPRSDDDNGAVEVPLNLIETVVSSLKLAVEADDKHDKQGEESHDDGDRLIHPYVTALHPTNTGAFCSQLELFSHHPRLQVSIVRFGGVEPMLAVLKRPASDPATVITALDTLRHLCGNPANDVSIAGLDGVDSILLALNHHAKHERVVLIAYVLLGDLALNEVHQVSIVRLDGVEVLLSALSHHRIQEHVVAAAFRVIVNLTESGDNTEQIVQKGGVDTILATLTLHIGNTELVEMACDAIINLANSDKNKVSIAQKGGVEVLLRVLTRHTAHSGVVEAASEALQELATNADNEELIIRLGGREVIQRAA